MKLPLRYAAIAIASVSLSGSALAATSVSTTGPGSANVVDYSSRTEVSTVNDNLVNSSNSNSQRSMSGSVNAGSNTGGGGYGYGGDWSSLNPSSWQNGGRGFGDWWNTMMMHGVDHSDGWNGSNSSYKPSGDNWQNDWNSWDPQMWKDNGSSYGNWMMHVLPHLNSNYNNWMGGWGNGSSGGGNTSVGSLSSGEADNFNATSTSVTASNPGGSGAALLGLGSSEAGDVFIGNTGPDSYNLVSGNNDVRYSEVNRNYVSVNNSNDQSAMSGDISANRNTGVGGLSSGSALNTNTTDTMLNLFN